MKNKLNIIICVLALSSAFLPLTALILYPFGYSVSLANYNFFAICLAVAFVFSTYCISKKENSETSKTTKIIAVFLPLLSVFNLAVYVFKSKSATVALCMVICIICVAVIAEKIIESKKAKVISVISSGLISAFAVIFSFITVFSAQFGENTVVKVVNSPNRTYYAEVVDIDQGTFGGDTVVYVYRNKNINLKFLCIMKTPQRVYTGDWGEYKTMQLEWKDEKNLVIDEKEYTVNI